MPLPRTAATLAAALVLAGAAAPARADLIGLRDGRVLEGKATKTPKQVTVKLFKGKTQTFAASEVKYVEEGECSWDTARKMAAAIPADASDELFVEGHLGIARFLKDRRAYCAELEELERKEYDLVLKKAPENEEARNGLGHKRWGQWWFPGEKELEKFRKGAPPAQMEPLGYVKYRKTGLWETKEDVEAMDAGKVRFKGKWMTPDEKKEAEGYVKDEKGNWALKRDIQNRERTEQVEKTLGEKPGIVTSSANFRFISWLSAGETAKLKDTAEKAYEWVRDVLGYPAGTAENPGEALFDDAIDVYLLVDGDRKDKWVEAFGPGLGYEPTSIDFYKKGTGWHRLAPTTHFVSSGKKTEKNRQRDVEEDYEVAARHVCSMVGRAVLDRVRPGGHPAWLAEASGFLTEVKFNETADCCYVTETKYREEIAGKDGSKQKYYEFMKGQVASGLDRPLRQIFTLELNYLDWADTVKAWSFVEFLREKHPTQLKELIRRPFPAIEQITPEHVTAAIQAMKPKDPAAVKPGTLKDEGPPPTAPIAVGPGNSNVTQGSKEERAVRGAQAEAWLKSVLNKDILALEAEWKAWLKGK
jgi:hypothetical protein